MSIRLSQYVKMFVSCPSVRCLRCRHRVSGNVLLAGAVFYFGFEARLFRKNIAIKLNKFLPKTILQYFYLHKHFASFKF